MFTAGNIALHRGINDCSTTSWTATQVVDATGMLVTFVAGGALLGLALSGVLPISPAYTAIPLGLFLVATIDFIAASLIKNYGGKEYAQESSGSSNTGFVEAGTNHIESNENGNFLDEDCNTTAEFPDSFDTINTKNYSIEKVTDGFHRQGKCRIKPRGKNQHYHFYIKETRVYCAISELLAYKMSELFNFHVVPELKILDCKQFDPEKNHMKLYDYGTVIVVQRAVKQPIKKPSHNKYPANVISAHKNFLLALLMGNHDTRPDNVIRNKKGNRFYSIDNELQKSLAEHSSDSQFRFCEKGMRFIPDSLNELNNQPIDKKLIKNFLNKEHELTQSLENNSHKNFIDEYSSFDTEEIQEKVNIILDNFKLLKQAFSELDYKEKDITPSHLIKKLRELISS